MVVSTCRSALCLVGLLGQPFGAAGCFPAESDVVAVSGRVTLGGEPLAGAVVTMQPVDAGQGAGDRFRRADRRGRPILPDADRAATSGGDRGRAPRDNHDADSSTDDAKLPTANVYPAAGAMARKPSSCPRDGTSTADFALYAS